MVCLERRRAELGTLTAALATADRLLVTRAVDAVGGLGDLAQCADKDMLLAIAPPTDPALRKKVDAVEAEIAASNAMEFAQHPPERQARAQAALEAARQLGQLPQLVHALEELHDAANDNRDDDVRETALRELGVEDGWMASSRDLGFREAVLEETGGVGVREIRRPGKDAGGPGAEGKLALAGAYGADLLGRSGETRARAAESDGWSRAQPADRLAALLTAWWSLPYTPLRDPEAAWAPVAIMALIIGFLGLQEPSTTGLARR